MTAQQRASAHAAWVRLWRIDDAARDALGMGGLSLREARHRLRVVARQWLATTFGPHPPPWNVANLNAARCLAVRAACLAQTPGGLLAWASEQHALAAARRAPVPR